MRSYVLLGCVCAKGGLRPEERKLTHISVIQQGEWRVVVVNKALV